MDIKRKIKQAANIIGIDELRKSQVKPINDILEGRDTMVVARPSAGKSEQKECLQKFIRGEVKMLFITPERFIKEEFLCTMKAVAVYMVVVDECHAVLDWGYSFRDAYLNLGQTIDELEARPIITALTATATEDDMAEIAQCLHMQNPAMYRNDLYNPKLCIHQTACGEPRRKT